MNAQLSFDSIPVPPLPMVAPMTCPNCLQYQAEIERLKAIIKLKDQAAKADLEVYTELSPEELRAMWNVIPGVKRCKVLLGPSLKTVKARLREHPKKAWWLHYFDLIARSAFLTGASTNWSATLVWACGPKNMSKVLAGDYTEQSNPAKLLQPDFHEQAILAWSNLRRSGSSIKGFSREGLKDPIAKSCFEAMGGEASGAYAKPFGSWPEHQESHKRREFIELYQAKAKQRGNHVE